MSGVSQMLLEASQESTSANGKIVNILSTFNSIIAHSQNKIAILEQQIARLELKVHSKPDENKQNSNNKDKKNRLKP